MLGITPSDDVEGDRGDGGGSSSSALSTSSSAIAALNAHVTVLEVVVDYLVSGGRPAEGRDRVGELFELEGRAESQAKAKAEAVRMERRAVEKCADWAVGAWSVAASGGGRRGSGPAEGGSARHGGGLDPGRARARLLTVRLLSGVVEACGLPVREACAAIRDRMDAVGLPPPSAVAQDADAGEGSSVASARGGCGGGGGDDGGGGGGSAGALPRRGLGAVACEGLVRALCWRPFGAELARVLYAGLPAAGSAAGDEEDVVRLRLLLSRAIRRAAGGAGGRVLLV